MPGAPRRAIRGGARRRAATLLAGAAGTLLTALLAGLTAVAPPAQAAAAAGTATDDAKAWLLRIRDAADKRNYQGTLVISAGGEVSSSRVEHYYDGQGTFERVDGLDGERRRSLRHDEQLQTLWPANRVALIEHREALRPFPALPGSGHEQIFASYEVKLDGQDRVAGHAARVLLLQPRDEARFAQRLWADTDSGLLLRSEVLDAQGRVLESASFTEVRIGVRPQADAIAKAMKQLDGYRVLRPQTLATSLDAEGWKLAVPIGGFKLVHCMRRVFDGGGERAGGPVLQALYSDGLTHVSVFVEPYRAQAHKPVEAAMGATHTLTQRRGEGWWMTVMGDVPIATLRRFANALERR